MNLKGNLTSKGLQGSIGKSRMQGILGTNPAAIPISVDNALSLSSTNPVQNKVITAAITNRLWSDEVKAALLQIVEKVAYIDADGQDYYDALYDALYPPVGLDSIVAVFDSSATIYNTMTLDDLKQHLTVTAYYTSGDSEEVTTYTLSGSMDAGTQTITVSYGGKTTTFSVTVVEWLVSISAVFTQGSATIYDTDSLDTLKQYLVVTATYADSTTAVVTDYTLSGTLENGTCTITASYGGKTDTFNVTVTAAVYPMLAYGIGGISSDTGEDTTATNRIRTDYIPVSSGDSIALFSTGLRFLVRIYNSNHEFTGNSGTSWISTSWAATTAGYVRLVIKKTDDSDFTDSELDGYIVGTQNEWWSLGAQPTVQVLNVQNGIGTSGESIISNVNRALSGMFDATYLPSNRIAWYPNSQTNSEFSFKACSSSTGIISDYFLGKADVSAVSGETPIYGSFGLKPFRIFSLNKATPSEAVGFRFLFANGSNTSTTLDRTPDGVFVINNHVLKFVEGNV